VFAVWGWIFNRNTVLLPFVALPFLADLWSTYKLKAKLKKQAIKIAWIVCLYPTLSNAGVLFEPFPKTLLDQKRLPVKACEFISSNKINGNVYNELEWGGYIYWSLGRETKIFLDGRYIFYDILTNIRYLNHQLLRVLVFKPWADFLNSYDIEYAIVNASSTYFRYPEEIAPFSLSLRNIMFKRSEWALVYWDDTAFIFLKRIKKGQDFIDKHEYKFLWPYNLGQMEYLMENKMIPISKAEEELERNLSIVGKTHLGEEMRKIIKVENNSEFDPFQKSSSKTIEN